MIQLSGVSKHYGGVPVLRDVHLALAPGDCVGLIGRNGSGKTTLLRIITGQEEADSGAVTLAPGTEIGYLGQEGQLTADRTLYEEMEAVFADVFSLEAELRRLEQAMGTLSGDDLEAVMRHYDVARARFDHAGQETIDARIRTVLYGLGFRPRDLERPCREFSGGWQMRGAMARLLLRTPNLLLLDEPTNHLDVAAVEWLESYLDDYPGTVILVSHDRYFLDATCSRMLDLVDGRLISYEGNYSYYLVEKEKRREQQEQQFTDQQKELERVQKFIERFRYKATLATRVKSKEKALKRIERVTPPRRDGRPMRLSFLPAVGSGRYALVAKGLSKAYGPIQVLKNIEAKVERGERVALVGPNGAGKSTLLRLLAGIEPPDSGSVNPGYKLQPVYFAQHQAEALDPRHTVLESLSEVAAPDADQTRLRTLLGCLLFTGDEVHKKVGVLSGGEKSRVALARCVIRPSNILFLDEPTNHLDMANRETLLSALQDYEGSILFISHDRSFMDGLGTVVWQIGDGQLVRHLGTYSEFRERQEAEAKRARQLEESARARAPKTPARKNIGPASGTKVRWTLEALEARIVTLEDEIAALAARMGQPEFYHDPDAATREQARYESLTQECQDLTALWEEMTTE